jgi:2-polyprenyl-6-methoxyphenol hydroxylase-like FAD-dependent oxidoreductase
VIVATETMTTRCCIAGGGPAGMMLGFLLGRANVEVVVLEKHENFFRDFRGDTIHPSTLQVIYELGLLDEFLKLPHQRVEKLSAVVGSEPVTLADFTHLPTHCRFIAFMPQWDFLNFLADHAKRYQSFALKMQAEAMGPIFDGECIVGVHVKTPDGPLDVRADLVVDAEGRHSELRDASGLDVVDLGAPMDVLWMRLSKKPTDDPQTLGRIETGRFFIMLDRGDYWQCAYAIPKGGYDELRARGLDAFCKGIVDLSPTLADRVQELASWNDVQLLTVRVDRLKRWYREGLLCIGDAAHAMSPIGGVGVNLAVQDAVATANILAVPLAKGPVPISVLAKVQARRQWPTEMTQSLQILIQNRVISNVLSLKSQPKPPAVVKLFDWIPWLRRIPARLIGMGFRPEHIKSPELPQAES